LITPDGELKLARLLDNLPDDITIAVTSLTENLKLQNLPDHGQAIFNILDTWLLDDEQQQMLHLSPWNIYFLFAAAHLFTSAAATAGEKQAHITKSVKQYAGIIRIRLTSFPPSAAVFKTPVNRWPVLTTQKLQCIVIRV
jgi:hypothetical protein